MRSMPLHAVALALAMVTTGCSPGTLEAHDRDAGTIAPAADGAMSASDAASVVGASFIGVDLPREMARGGWTYRATLTVRNNLDRALVAGQDYVAARGAADVFLGGTGRVDFPARVEPGTDVTIGVVLTSPSERGEFATEWQVTSAAGAPLGDAVARMITIARPRFIEFGWDTPTTPAAAMAADLSNVPLDGVVLDPMLVSSSGADRRFANAILSNERMTQDELERDGRTSGVLSVFARFPDNLLRINISGLGAGWSGDWSTVLANVDTAAELVARYGMRGILFDTELYGTSTIWDPSGGTVEDARARGRDFGARYGAGAPHTTVLFTMAHTFVAGQQGVGSHGYDLLAPFLDGMMESAPESISFVDGYEISYGFRDRGGWFPNSFDGARTQIRSARSLSLSPEIYDRRMKAGFGIWLDFRSEWDPATFANNYFTPEEFGTSATAARDASDGWVWIYTQRVTWYSGSDLIASDGGGFYSVPDAYRAALSAARP